MADHALQLYQSTLIRNLTWDKKGSRSIYKCLNDISNHRPFCELKWKIKFGLQTTFDWERFIKHHAYN